MISLLTNKELLQQFTTEIAPYVTIHDADMAKALFCLILAHGETKDKEGEFYFLHPIRVSKNFVEKDAIIVSLLHDVLEDSKLTEQDLISFGFSQTIVEAVNALTRCRLQSYSSYLTQLSTNTIAKEVKRADILDNSNPDRLAKLKPFTRNRLTRKYKKALRILDMLQK